MEAGAAGSARVVATLLLGVVACLRGRQLLLVHNEHGYLHLGQATNGLGGGHRGAICVAQAEGERGVVPGSKRDRERELLHAM